MSLRRPAYALLPSLAGRAPGSPVLTADTLAPLTRQLAACPAEGYRLVHWDRSQRTIVSVEVAASLASVEVAA